MIHMRQLKKELNNLYGETGTETEYSKFKYNGKVFYVDKRHTERLLKEFLYQSSQYGITAIERQLVMMANFVVDNNGNKMLKCRSSLEDILDSYTGV